MYVEPDWTSPIDFEARLSAVPEDAQVRGMFLQLLLQAVHPETRVKLGPRRYLAFKNYPLREYIGLLQLCCESMPSVPAAECVRRLGRAVYPTYATTVTGTAIFAMAGNNFRRVAELAPAAYKIAIQPGTITVRSVSDTHAEVEFREVYNLPDFHQVGIWEGAMAVCRARGTIRVRAHDFSSADFAIEWTSEPRSHRP
ncbi:MAG TPA: DUF2378 family protein [Polyangiales bacterium]|nr:DUF2378 family protein [Polyangiales bacterium]